MKMVLEICVEGIRNGMVAIRHKFEIDFRETAEINAQQFFDNKCADL